MDNVLFSRIGLLVDAGDHRGDEQKPAPAWTRVFAVCQKTVRFNPGNFVPNGALSRKPAACQPGTNVAHEANGTTPN